MLGTPEAGDSLEGEAVHDSRDVGGLRCRPEFCKFRAEAAESARRCSAVKVLAFSKRPEEKNGTSRQRSTELSDKTL